MPAKSAAQYKFMAGIAHGMKSYKKNAPSAAVAEDFVHKTPAKLRTKFSKGPKKLVIK